MIIAHTHTGMRLGSLLVAFILILPLTDNLSAQGIESEVGKVFASYKNSGTTDRSTQAIKKAADIFLENLDEILISKAKLPFNTPEKAVWSNLPPNLDYAGIRIADLSPSELDRLVTLLATSLSPSGFEKVRGIMLGDDLLVRGDQTGNRMLFGADNYWFFIYGTPSLTEPWGWQFDGHHLAINLTITKDDLTLSPSFIGTQPADVEWGKRYSSKPMSKEVSLAFKLVGSLSSAQSAKTIIGPRRQNLDAGPGADEVQPPRKGIKGSELTKSQKTTLDQLVNEWLRILPAKYAQKRQQEIRSTIDKTHFAWWGDTAPGSAVYFRVQGPEVLIEFAHQNLGGDPQQHLHSVYRDPSNDYGRHF